MEDNEPLPLDFVDGDQDIIQKSFDVFCSLDRDGDRYLNQQELKRGLSMFHEKYDLVTEEDAARILGIAGKRHPGYLCFSEFYNVYAALHMLNQLDLSDLHHLKPIDVRNALLKAGLKPSRAVVEQMFRIGDQYATYDRLGRFDFVEFLNIYINTPQNAPHVFLNAWFSAGRNAIPYSRPVVTSPLEDFIAGTAAGIALTLVGHPFDTIKVRLQTMEGVYKSSIDCLLRTVHEEGFKALYKGMSGPLLTIPLVNAIVFSAYGQAKDFIHSLQKEEKPLNLWQISAAGAWAGFVNCLIITPVELIKTHLQIQSDSQKVINQQRHIHPPSPTYTHSSSLPRAHCASFSTSIAKPQLSFWSRLKRCFSSTPKSAIPSQTPHQSYHSTSYYYSHPSPSASAVPVTRYRTVQFASSWDCCQVILREYGVRGLYRGMFATILREIPGYGGQFFMYELLKQKLTPKGEKATHSTALLSGGLAGLFSWIVSYPQDFIKSQLQSEPIYIKETIMRKEPVRTTTPTHKFFHPTTPPSASFSTSSASYCSVFYGNPPPPKYIKNPYLFDGGFFDCWKKTVKQEGFMALWRGFGPCVARSFPANAAGFLAYEGCLSLMQSTSEEDEWA